jgi:ECF sigma factor
MSVVTRILAAIDRGESHAAEQLLPPVYDELRRRSPLLALRAKWSRGML